VDGETAAVGNLDTFGIVQGQWVAVRCGASLWLAEQAITKNRVNAVSGKTSPCERVFREIMSRVPDVALKTRQGS